MSSSFATGLGRSYSLVGAGEQCRWHTEAQRFGGIEVDEQLDLCRLLDWQVGYVLAFENSAGRRRLDGTGR